MNKKVIVTTERRGVFFGDLVEAKDSTVQLANVRMAIYWGTTKGVLELAQTGPTPKSKIGAVAPTARLNGVTGIFGVTEEAAEKWAAA